MAIVFIEPRPKSRHEYELVTGYVVESGDSCVLHEAQTQAEAVDWSTRRGHTVHVARARNFADKTVPDHWRDLTTSSVARRSRDQGTRRNWKS